MPTMPTARQVDPNNRAHLRWHELAPVAPMRQLQGRASGLLQSGLAKAFEEFCHRAMLRSTQAIEVSGSNSCSRARAARASSMRPPLLNGLAAKAGGFLIAAIVRLDGR